MTLYLSAVRLVMSCTRAVQWWGLGHSRAWSCAQAVHMQLGFGR